MITRATFKQFFFWIVLLAIPSLVIVAAGFSPLLQWRGPVYISASFAGIIAFLILLLQPLLILGLLPGISKRLSRASHRFFGGLLFLAILIHIGGLYLTSAPDVIDALVFRSPTPFSVWGVLAMWAVFATTMLAVFRNRLKIPYLVWRFMHVALALIVASGTILHVVLIEGIMEPFSKIALCILVAFAVGAVCFKFFWNRAKN